VTVPAGNFPARTLLEPRALVARIALQLPVKAVVVVDSKPVVMVDVGFAGVGAGSAAAALAALVAA
jgi:hypothetical protein